MSEIEKELPPHKAKNGIPPQIIDATDNNNEVSGKELHAHDRSTKEALICPQPSQTNYTYINRGINHKNNIIPSLDAPIANHLNDGRIVEDNKPKDNNNSDFFVELNGGSRINHKSVESTKITDLDTACDLSDKEQLGPFDFSDSDLPDTPEIEKSAVSFQKQVIIENSLSETEQENSSDNEDFNPFEFRKKKSKTLSTVTVDLNTLPTRISTRYRKPVIENVTAKILRPTYLTEQESQIDGDIVAENIKRLKIHNELKTNRQFINDKSVLKSSNENKSQNRTDASNNETKDSTNSETEISTRKCDDSNKHQEQNETEIETLDSTSVKTTRITRSNSKISQHKPFELACARFQEEINASINKNRSFYKTPEKERSKSPELVGRLKMPKEAMKQVLKSSGTVSTLVESPTQVATSSDSKDTRNGPQKTIHRRSLPHATPKQVSTSFGSIFTQSKLKKPPNQTVSKPCETAVTQVRPPDPSELISTSSAVTQTAPQEAKTQVSKPTKTLITRSRAQLSIFRRNKPQISRTQVSKSSDTVLTRNRAPKSVITPCRVQLSKVLVTKDSQKLLSKYPKNMLPSIRLQDYSKQVTASSNSVMTRRRLKDSYKQPSETVITQVKPQDSPKQILTLTDSTTIRKRILDPRKEEVEVTKSSEMVVTHTRRQKATVRRNKPQEHHINVSKLTDNLQSKTQVSKTSKLSKPGIRAKSALVTKNKPLKTVFKQKRLKTVTRRSRPEKTVTQIRPQKPLVTQSKVKKTVVAQKKLLKTVTTRSRPEKTVTQARPKKNVVTQSRPQKPLAMQNKVQKTVVTQKNLLKTVTTCSRPKNSVITQSRSKKLVQSKPQKPLTQNRQQKTEVTLKKLLNSVTTRSRPEKTEVTQIRSQKPIVTKSRPLTPLVTQNKLQKVIVTQKKPLKSVTTRSRPKKTVRQVTPQKTVVTQNRPHTTKVSLITQNTAITRTKPQQTTATKRPSSPKASRIKRQRNIEKIETRTVKVSRSILKNNSGSNISSSAESRRNLKRSLPFSDSPSSKRTRVFTTSNVNNASSRATPIQRKSKRPDTSRNLVMTKAAVNRRDLKKKPSSISQ